VNLCPWLEGRESQLGKDKSLSFQLVER